MVFICWVKLADSISECHWALQQEDVCTMDTYQEHKCIVN